MRIHGGEPKPFEVGAVGIGSVYSRAMGVDGGIIRPYLAVTCAG